MDAPGHDLEQGEGNVATLMVQTVLHFPRETTAKVAAFNTNGWIKTKVLPRMSFVRWSDFLLDGLYIRTGFFGHAFYPRVTSPRNDIERHAGLANNVPALVAIAYTLDKCVGFNTRGWFKYAMTIPPK